VTFIPLCELEKRVREVPGYMEVVVVCRTGNRNKKGRDILLKAGLSQETNMQGGVKEWRADGHSVVSGR
jgi:rhodanese-related sulfurtransferase